MTSPHTRPQAEAIRNRMLAGERFKAEEVIAWMHSEDRELEGAAYQVVTASRSVVDGFLEREVVDAFLPKYFLLCMARQDSETQLEIFPLQPYVAANCLASWYRAVRLEVSAEHPALVAVRDALKSMYVEGGEIARSRVVHGILEHVFESLRCRADFLESAGDSELRVAYREAEEWGDAHLRDDTGPVQQS
jgi:hypothetical protein